MTAAVTAADLLEEYVSVGLAVLPLHRMNGGRCTCGRRPGKGPRDCPSPAKHPRTRNGKDDASTDPGQVAEWLARWPTCNWGVRPPVGVIVLDVDPRNRGDRVLALLQAEHGRLPPTLTAQTGSGGLHIWLSHNGPTRGTLGQGIDVKSHSGYLVAPPSVHQCGGTYEWIDEHPAAYAPRWVQDRLNPPVLPSSGRGHHGAGIDGLVRFVLGSQPGGRNGALYWAACRAAEKDVDPAPLVDAAVSIGLTHREAEATVNSALKAPTRPHAAGREVG